MCNKNADELYALLESGELTDEMIIKEITAETAFKVLVKRVSRCLKNNDEHGALNVDKSVLCSLLSEAQKHELVDIELAASCDITEKFLNGE
jgi:hypothetical protein